MQRFFDIVEDEYRRSIEAAARSGPLMGLRGISRGLLGRQAEPLIVGGVIGTVAGHALARTLDHLKTHQRRAS